MSVNKRRSRNLYAKLALGLCIFQCGLMAQEEAELVLFSITDDQGNHIEVVVTGEGGLGETVVRHYEDNVLILEWPLQGHLRIDGLSVSPVRVLVLNKNGAEREPFVTAIYIVDPLLITNEGGSTIPPSGPPPTPGGEESSLVGGN